MKPSTNRSTTARPLIRWAGSKRRLLPILLDNSPATFNTYFEPFVGSACLFLALKPARAILGDINAGLIRTYRTVKARPANVFQSLERLSSSQHTYYRLRATDSSDLRATDYAVRFLYLNRHAFNGVYRENSSGHFNVPFGSKIPALHAWSEFKEFANRLRSAELRSEDFENCVSHAKRGDFVYLDPPYAKQGARNRGEYGSDAFQSDDVARLVQCVRRLDKKGVNVLLSFFDSAKLRRELSTWNIKSLKVNRSVCGFSSMRRKAREVLIRNY